MRWNWRHGDALETEFVNDPAGPAKSPVVARNLIGGLREFSHIEGVKRKTDTLRYTRILLSSYVFSGDYGDYGDSYEITKVLAKKTGDTTGDKWRQLARIVSL